MKQKGFTLAEVLITLGIIGVIAAITIPAVISSSSQEQYVTGVKKAYNTLKAIEREAKLEHGDIENWTIGSDKKVNFDTYFRPYMDILKDCGLEGTGCFVSACTYLDGTAGVGPSEVFYKVITSDGMAFAFYQHSTGGWIIVDVNGPKKPNTMGRDQFYFEIDKALGIKPRGFKETGAITDCSKTSQGLNCATKVLTEGQMKY